jgi:hypothetical protein
MSSSSTTVTIPDHYDIHIGGEPVPLKTDSEIKLDPIHIHSYSKSESGAKVELKADIDTKSKIDLKADIDTKSKADIDTRSLIDVKPLAIDSCQTLKLAPLPPICMEQPYSHHFGFTWMGQELFGFSMHGKQDTFLTSPTKPRHFGMSPRESYVAPCGPCDESKPRPHKSGLRVKVGE